MPFPLPSASVPTVTRTTRDVLHVAGPEAIAFLQGQLSQDVAGLAVGGSAWSFVLQPQGKVDAWFRVARTADDAVDIDIDAGWGAGAQARIERFKLRTKAEVTLVEAVPTLAVRGVALAGGLPAGWPGLAGSDHIGSTDLPADLPATAVELDHEAFDAVRIALGVPALGHELTDATIPAEAGQWVIDASVSFSKGCYTGQELVARIDSRGGNVPLRLRGFTTDALPPAPGAVVLVGGEPAGHVTSSAIASDGSVVGLAYLKRSVEPPVGGSVDGEAVELFEVPRPVD